MIKFSKTLFAHTVAYAIPMAIIKEAISFEFAVTLGVSILIGYASFSYSRFFKDIQR